MLILSAAVSIPGVIGMACQSKEHKASEKAAFRALGGLSGGESNRATSEASFDALIQSAESPELKKFAEGAKSKADQGNELKELSAEASAR